eukprot:Transcript_25214.p1 GENE.Transcript_25214~~Transcript_25214.p1  ORF type:complete len:300 (-),score=25.28 Transcript_25214:915-1814(-)
MEGITAADVYEFLEASAETDGASFADLLAAESRPVQNEPSVGDRPVPVHHAWRSGSLDGTGRSSLDGMGSSSTLSARDDSPSSSLPQQWHPSLSQQLLLIQQLQQQQQQQQLQLLQHHHCQQQQLQQQLQFQQQQHCQRRRRMRRRKRQREQQMTPLPSPPLSLMPAAPPMAPAADERPRPAAPRRRAAPTSQGAKTAGALGRPAPDGSGKSHVRRVDGKGPLRCLRTALRFPGPSEGLELACVPQCAASSASRLVVASAARLGPPQDEGCPPSAATRCVCGRGVARGFTAGGRWSGMR